MQRFIRFSAVFVLFLLSFSVSLFGQQAKYMRTLEICERYYEEGAYRKSLDLCLKAIARAERHRLSLAANKLLLYKAKYYEALGKYYEFEATLYACLEQREKVYTKNSIIYGKGLLDGAALYLSYSDFATAESFLNNAEQILSHFPKTKEDTYFEAMSGYISTQIAFYRGDYTTAEALIPALLAIKKKRIVNAETAFDAGANSFVERRLNKFEQQRRKRAYAEILTLKGKIARRAGNYAQAEKDLAEAQAWIKDNLPKKGMAFINNRHEEIMLMFDKGLETDKAKKKLEKNLFLAERKMGLVHKDFLKIHEAAIDYYIEDRFSRKSRIEQWELNNNTSKYYGENRTAHAHAVRLNAKRHFYAKDYERARNMLLELRNDSTKTPPNHSERMRVLKQLYAVSVAEDRYIEAKKYLDELQKVQAKILGKESLDYHYANLALASYYQTYTNRFASVDSLFRKSFNGVVKQRISETHKDYLPFLKQRISYYQILGKYDSAKMLAEEVVEISKKKFGDKHHRYAAGLDALTGVNLAVGNYKQADENINKMLDIFASGYKRRRLDSEYARILETSARYYAMVGLFESAQDNLAKANRLSSRSVKAVASSSAVDELAYLYIKTGRYDETEKLLKDAIRIRQQRYGDSSRFLITPYTQLANLRQIKGDYIEAQELARKGYEIAAHNFGEKSLQTNESLLVEADIYTAIGDFERAKENITKVMGIKNKLLGENHVELANSYTKLALVRYFNGEDLSQITSLFQKAQQIISNNLGEDNPVYAVALKNLSLVHLENQEYDQALKLLNRAEKIWAQKLGTTQSIQSAEIKLLAGDVELRRGKAGRALSAYQRGRKIYQKKLGKNHPNYVKSVAKIGRAYYTLSKFRKSRKHTERALKSYLGYIKLFFPVLSEREKSRYWSLIRSDFEFYTNLAFNTPKKKKLFGSVYNNILQTKALLLSSSIKIRNRIVESGDPDLVANYQEWVSKKDRLTEVLSMSVAQRKQENADPKRLQREIENIEKTLSKHTLFDAGEEEKISWKDVKKALHKDEAAIEIVRYRHFDKQFTDSVVYAALIVSPKFRKVRRVFFPDGNYLEKGGLSIYRSSVNYEIEDTESYHNFWAPIAKALPKIGKGGKIYLSSEGVFNQINIEGLMLEDKKNFVIDVSNIILVSNTKDLVLSRPKGKGVETEQKKQSTLVGLFGNPVFYEDLGKSEYNTYTNRPITQLPGTMTEIEKLDELLKKMPRITPQTYLTTDASEEQVRTLKNPRIFHIATHGFFLPDQASETESGLQQERATENPLLRSGLLLKNAGDLMKDPDNVYAFNRKGGVLTAYEAMNLNFDNTELVVLSACETGKGDVKVGEGVYGLQRAFLVAGADAIVMSLFKVDDQATQQLMLNFYRNWFEKQMDKRAAFTQAKIDLRKTFSEPKYWSAFIMIGSI